MELSKTFIEETVTFMKKQGVASFEITPDGVMKVSFDPRGFIEDTSIVTTDVIKQKIQDLVVDGEAKMRKEEEDFLYSST